MLPTEIVFGLTGVGLFVLGLRATLLHESLLARILAINVCGAGVFLMFVSVAYQGVAVAQVPDPVPHALVLTGIVVAVSATALALALGRRLRESDDE